MDLVEAVAIFITGILASAVAYRLVIIAPLGQSTVDIVLVGKHERTRQDCLLNQRLDRFLAYVFQHVYNYLAAALDHTNDRGLLLFKRASAWCAFEAVSAPLAALFFTADGCPL